MSEYPPHDEFLKLCAIAVSGQLRADEQRRLEEHLAGCRSCRQAMDQYQEVARQVLSAMAPEFLADPAEEDSTWSEDRAEAELLARLEREQLDRQTYPIDRSDRFSTGRRNHRWQKFRERAIWRAFGYAAAAVLIIAVGICVYRYGERRGVESAERNRTVRNQPETQLSSPTPDPERRRLQEEVDNRDAAIGELRRQLEQQAAVVTGLQKQQSRLEKQLEQGTLSQEGVTEQRIDLMAQLDAAHMGANRLQQDLQSLIGKSARDAIQNKDLEVQVTALRSQLKDQQDMIEQQQELLAHDRDIRELMGARDLYIAEVYDVAGAGATKKPYGRLFYTKGKSLIFYAYDLDQQRGLKNASTFQAWGRRGPNWKQATNLGVFYEDSAAKKRWVLRFDDPKKLAEIDAVFVTVEPDGGSQKPSGKPLLFAYLKIDPNHP